MTGHAEIAGGGFAGLVAAVALARRGWSVRVHERSDALRQEGFAIGVHENALRVLAAIGVLDHLLTQGRRVSRLVRVNAAGRELTTIVPAARLYRLPRRTILAAVAERARSEGVAISYGSTITGAEDGALIGQHGERYPCDLAIGADGIRSQVRDSMNWPSRSVIHRDGAMRLMVGADPDDPTDTDHGPIGNPSFEYWSGRRRIIRHRSGTDDVYVAITAENRDVSGSAVPLDLTSWRKAFPKLGSFLERVRFETDWSVVRWAPFETRRPATWSRGRVALVGDAVTAMPPNLGQGGGIAMMNALSLAFYASQPGDLRSNLVQWEQAERPISDHTQRWSGFYSAMGVMPDVMRDRVIALLGTVPWVRRQYQRAASHIPTGASQ